MNSCHAWAVNASVPPSRHRKRKMRWNVEHPRGRFQVKGPVAWEATVSLSAA